MKLKEITEFEDIEEYKNNLTFVVEGRIAMSNDGKKLFEAEEFKGKSSFSAYLIVDDKEQKEGVMKVRDYLAEKHLSGDLPENPDYIAIKDGDECTYSSGDNKGEIYEGFEGNVAIKLKRLEKSGAPEVYSEQGDLIEKYPDKRVYHDGARVRIQVRMYAYSQDFTGIGADFDAVLYIDKDERIVGKGGGAKVNKSALFKGHNKDKGVDSRNDVFGSKKKDKDKKKKNKKSED